MLGDRGPTVVKLAGIVGGVRLYREGAEAAAAAGFRVALLDTAGDRRDDPAPAPLSWDLLTREVCLGMDQLAVDRAILWGTSFGCLVALAVAARHPERVRGLLLGNPPEPGVHPRLFPGLVRWAAGRPDPVEPTRRLFRVLFGALVGWEFAYPTALWRAPSLIRANRDASTPAHTLYQKLQLLWGEPPGLPPAQARIPVSLIGSPFDFAAPLSGVRRYTTLLPQAHLRLLPLTGHSGHYSRPRAFARIVVEELRRLDGAQ